MTIDRHTVLSVSFILAGVIIVYSKVYSQPFTGPVVAQSEKRQLQHYDYGKVIDSKLAMMAVINDVMPAGACFKLAG
jgi:hypothetical protein